MTFETGNGIFHGTLVVDRGDYRIQTLDGSQYLSLRAADNKTVLVPGYWGLRVTDRSNSRNNLFLNNDPDLNGFQMFLPYGKLLEGSDSRQKKNQEPLDYGLAEVLELEPKRYNRTNSVAEAKISGQASDEKEHGSEIGLIAQEVYEVIPEAVGKAEDHGKEIWLLSYSSLVPVLVKAVQEQQAMIEKQEEINAEQGAKIASLEKRIAALEQR